MHKDNINVIFIALSVLCFVASIVVSTQIISQSEEHMAFLESQKTAISASDVDIVMPSVKEFEEISNRVIYLGEEMAYCQNQYLERSVYNMDDLISRADVLLREDSKDGRVIWIWNPLDGGKLGWSFMTTPTLDPTSFSVVWVCHQEDKLVAVTTGTYNVEEALFSDIVWRYSNDWFIKNSGVS